MTATVRLAALLVLTAWKEKREEETKERVHYLHNTMLYSRGMKLYRLKEKVLHVCNDTIASPRRMILILLFTEINSIHYHRLTTQNQ
jgi:hypothetical protein